MGRRMCQLGVSRAYLCDVEKGRRAVSVERAAAWARKLGYLQAQYVALALQAEVTAAGLKLRGGKRKRSEPVASRIVPRRISPCCR